MKGIKNWLYKDVIEFLIFFGFKPEHAFRGSHIIWKNKEEKRVELYHRNNKKTFSPKGMIKILKHAGIPRWLAENWSNFTKKEKKKLKQSYDEPSLAF